MSRFRLGCDAQGQYLSDTFSRQGPLRIDFTNPRFLERLRHAGKKTELVARAVRAGGGLRVLDCTAGLAKDAFVLAFLGCEVTLVERSRVISILLRDGLKRAKQVPELNLTVNRINLISGNSQSLMAEAGMRNDVIYLDPMFPEKRGVAAVRGPMQLLQRFVGKDEDARELLSLALSSGCKRVVVKRPLNSGEIILDAPAHVFKNKNICFEVYAN